MKYLGETALLCQKSGFPQAPFRENHFYLGYLALSL